MIMDEDNINASGKSNLSKKILKHPLQEMFSNVPDRYDALNRFLTLNIDQRWRRQAALACLENEPATVIDMCSGTGDLAVMLGESALAETMLIALDFAKPMGQMAKEKINNANLNCNVHFAFADAGRLPMKDGSVDSMGIAFAFRNLTYKNPRRELYLSELSRVIRPGGRLVIAETSQPSNKLLRAGYYLYLKGFVAPLGGLFSGHKSAYRYLAHSAQNYYSPSEVKDMLLRSGFSKVEQKPLMFGVAAIHIATK